MKTALANLSRLIVAATLIVSGYVKSVDPLGTVYKFGDYLAALSLGGAVPEWTLLCAAVALGSFEFALGMFLLFAVNRKAVAWATTAFMGLMTLITVWVVVADPVEDCGCFGDFIHLTNAQTFGKNIILTALALCAALGHRRLYRLLSEQTAWVLRNYVVVFILAVNCWCLYALPVFDFRPYHVGADIRAGMEIPEGEQGPQFATIFIMEKNGERREFDIDHYPDSTWTFIDSRTTKLSDGYVPPIHDFSVVRTDTGDDITDSLLARRGYTFLLIAPHLERADDSHFGDIDAICDYAQRHGLPFYCLTASGEAGIAGWQDRTGAEYPFCHTDETTLKTIVRAAPGLVLLRAGKVVNKWSAARFPVDEMQATSPDTNPAWLAPQGSTAGKLLKLLLWFVLPLVVLTLADRTWAWSRYLRRKKKSHSQPHKQPLIMRKKIVAGNWKMNLNLQEGLALATELNTALTAEKPNCDVIICTPFIHLAKVADVLDQSVVALGAENCADKEKGAFTGEVSAAMVKSTGATYVILGHSERRGYYAETPAILKEKVLLALKNGLKVIFCIGESLEEREKGIQNDVVKAELEGSVFNLTAEEFANIVIAYEPIWAIGTGKTATSDQAEEIHAYIRSIVAEKYGKEVADNTSILYGGSCKASNAPELFAKPDIDGGLIGGASLKAPDFRGIIDAWK